MLLSLLQAGADSVSSDATSTVAQAREAMGLLSVT